MDLGVMFCIRPGLYGVQFSCQYTRSCQNAPSTRPSAFIMRLAKVENCSGDAVVLERSER